MTKQFTIIGVVVAVLLSILAILKPATIQTVKDGVTGAIEFNTGRTTYDQLADSVLQEKIVTVASASVKSIADFPIKLLNDAGPGRLNEIVSITGYRNFSSESFGFNQGNQSHEGFEIKWASPDVTASGLNGQLALGASFSSGFITGDADDGSGASRSAEFWVPSGVSVGNSPGASGTASISYVMPTLASRSAVYLTASSSFGSGSNETRTTFVFRIVYRLLRFP